MAAAFCLACAAALTGIWAIIALPPPIRAGLSALTLWGAWAAISRHALRRGKQAHVEAHFLPAELGGGNGKKILRVSGAVILRRADGQASRALVEDLFLSAPLAVMTARKVLPPGMAAPRGWRRIAGAPNWRRETIIVPGDCMDAESHRQFRIRARRARAASAEILHGDDPSALTDSTHLPGMGPTNFFLRLWERIAERKNEEKRE